MSGDGPPALCACGAKLSRNYNDIGKECWILRFHIHVKMRMSGYTFSLLLQLLWPHLGATRRVCAQDLGWVEACGKDNICDADGGQPKNLSD